MTRKTPQEKKRQSYLKDRRNTYAENSKSSRSAIRLHKRHVNQANRRAVHQAMSRAATGYDPEIAEQAESRLAGKRHKRWAKIPDTPLGEVVKKKLQRRVKSGIDHPVKVRTKIKRIRDRTK